MSSISINIKLETIEAVREFVDIVNRFEGDITLSSGKYIVDAKSIMGIFSLDLRMPITMTVESQMSDRVVEAVKKYAVK